MENSQRHPWETYLKSITTLNAWEIELLGQIKYDGTIWAEEACHVATDIIYLTRRLDLDTAGFKSTDDALDFCARLVGETCGSHQAACDLLKSIDSNSLKGNEAAQARLRALHGMLRICNMPGIKPKIVTPKTEVA